MAAIQSIPKPRIAYSAFTAHLAEAPRAPAPLSAPNVTGTIAWLTERFIREMNGTAEQPGIRPIGRSQMYSLRLLQRSPIGSVLAVELKKGHVIDHCKARRKVVCAATVCQDVIFLTGVLKYAGSAWDDCDDISDAAVAAAKPFLAKHQLIGKSTPRSRRPSPEEIERLIAYFSRPKTKGTGYKLPMVRMTLWQLRSSRRIGESCRLLWDDWNRDAHTILVRKMKDPRRRDKNKVVALPEEAQAMLEELWLVRDPNEPRIFPYNAKSVGAAYTLAKKKLGIVNLHLHDSRRDCGTRLVEDKGFSPAEAICFTGHESLRVFESTYLCMNPELLKDGPVAKRMSLPAVPAVT